jgi:hypothetical protein
MGTRYDRCLVLGLTADNGWFDFASQMDDRAANAGAKFGADSGFTGVECYRPKLTDICGGIVTPEEPSLPLPDKGVIASVISCSDVIAGDQQFLNSRYRPLLAWVSDRDHFGKIRIVAHGAAASSSLMMHSSADRSADARKSYVKPKEVVAFLCANGLTSGGDLSPRLEKKQGTAGNRPGHEPGGLRTIQLDICSGAEAKTNDGRSALEKFTASMTERGFKGIRVTASSQPVYCCPGKDQIAVIIKGMAQGIVDNLRAPLSQRTAKDRLEFLLKLHGTLNQSARAALSDGTTRRLGELAKSSSEDSAGLEPQDALDLTFKLFEAQNLDEYRTKYSAGQAGQWGTQDKSGKFHRLAKAPEKISMTS